MADAPEVLDQLQGETCERSGRVGPRRLPQLVGRQLVLFRILWSFALLLAVTAPIASFHFARVNEAEIYPPFSLLGLNGNTDGSLGRPFGSEARAQGVEKGARVLRVNNTPVPDEVSRRELAALLKAAPGPIVQLTTRTTSGTLRQHHLTRSERHLERIDVAAGITVEQRQLIRKVLSTLAAAAAVLVALLLFFRRPRDPVAALLSLGFLLVAATSGFASTVWTSFNAPPFLGSAVNSLGLAALGLALLTFPNGRFDAKRGIVIAFLLMGWFVFLPINYHYGFLSPGIATAGSAAVFLACLTVLVGRFRRLPQGMERQQIRWVLFGFAVAIAAGAVSAAAIMLASITENDFVRIWANIAASVATAFTTFSVAFGLLVSLLRYRLYDAEAAISRSAAIAVLTLTLAAVYAGASKGLEAYFETTFGREAGAVPGAIGAALAVLLFLPLNSRIQVWAERRFQAALLRLRRDFPVCLGDMRETSSMADLADETLEQVRDGVRARHSALVLNGEVLAACNIAPAEVASWYQADLIDHTRMIDCAPDDTLFPMRLKLRPRSRSGTSELGWLLLGPRPDGSFFGKDEREVLSEIVDPTARAIEIVQLREREKAQLEARLAALEGRFAKPRKGQGSARSRLVRPVG